MIVDIGVWRFACCGLVAGCMPAVPSKILIVKWATAAMTSNDGP